MQKREGMIMRVYRREVFYERGWGVSLRSTTCKGMVTIPGGELRCTGNLCNERHSLPEARLLDHKRLAKHRPAFFSNGREKKKETKNRTWTDEFSRRSSAAAARSILRLD